MNKTIAFALLFAASSYSASAIIKKENATQKLNNTNAEAISIDEKTDEANPLLLKWSGMYNGVPPFASVKVEHFKPALEFSMDENLKEIEKIASNTEASTFENTIAAMERSGQSLDRVQNIYGVWSSTMSDEKFQVVETDMEPKLAAFYDKITQNEKLFKRIESVYNSPSKKTLTSEQQRLVWTYYSNFVHSGARLDAQSKTRMSEINQELAGLFTKFSQNLLADETDLVLVLKTEPELAGLPQSIKDGATSAAGELYKGSWVIKNTRSSVDPFLTYSTRRDLREIA